MNALEKIKLIDDIGSELQSRMTFSEIDAYFSAYGNSCPGNKSEYKNAKSKKCMGCVIRDWPRKRLAVIYHCRTCDKIKRVAKSREKYQSS
jgi:hypothetical protein